MSDPRPTAGDCYVSTHRIEVFSRAHMQRVFIMLLRVALKTLCPPKFDLAEGTRIIS